jgi:hypothetical protein
LVIQGWAGCPSPGPITTIGGKSARSVFMGSGLRFAAPE